MISVNTMRFQVIITLTIFTITGIESKRNLIYGEVIVDCTHKVPYLISSYECHTKHLTTRVYGYGHIIFKRPIEAMGLQISIARNIGFQNMKILDLPLDLCEFLSTTQKHRYLDFLMKPIRKYVNEIPRCPLKESFNYTLTGAFLDAYNFPAFIPVGNITFIASFFDGKVKAGYFKIRGQIMTKEKKLKPSGGRKG